eukprot:Nk52_evm29s359 gene=Nk52_evmTU29s359
MNLSTVYYFLGVVAVLLSTDGLTMLVGGEPDRWTTLGCTHTSTKLSCGSNVELDDLSQYVLDCDGLEEIIFDGASVTNVPSGFFQGCSQVTTFELSGNSGLDSLPAGAFDGLEPLKFTLTYNSKLTEVPFQLVSSQKLNLFNISHNSIKVLDKGLFSGVGVKDLAILDLSHNQLEELKPSQFLAENSFKSVLEFSVNNNKIASVESGGNWPSSLVKANGLVSQTRLYNFSHNELTEFNFLSGGFQMTLCLGSQTCDLDFSYNKIVNFDKFIYTGYYALYLSGNPLVEIPLCEGKALVRKLVLEDTKELHALPLGSKGCFLEGKMVLGEYLSCCALGGNSFVDEVQYLRDTETITCALNGERIKFYLNDLNQLFSDNQNMCTCKAANCNMDSSLNATCTPDFENRPSYTSCPCNNPSECYTIKEGEPRNYRPDNPSSSKGGSFTNSTIFYVLIGCAGGVAVVGGVGILYWLLYAKKKKKSSIYADCYVNYDGEGGYHLNGMEKFDSPLEVNSPQEISNQAMDDEEFPERLGFVPENAQFLEVDESGHLIVQAGDEPPELPPRNDMLTSSNIKRLSIADRKQRIGALVEDAFLNSSRDDLYDPAAHDAELEMGGEKEQDELKENEGLCYNCSDVGDNVSSDDRSSPRARSLE